MHPRPTALLALSVLCLLPLHAQSAPANATDIELHGSITPAKYQTHETVSFTVPPGMARMEVELISPGFAKGMYVTIGLWDPERYRGEGRSRFTLSTVDATGPYMPGPIVAGTWHASLGYNFVAPDAHGEWTLKIHLSPRLDPETYPVLNPKPGWYRGDLHAHTGLTDAMCKSQSGANVPCPPYRLFAAAAEQKLDFLFVTDHNTQAHFNEMRQDSLYFDRLLLLPAEEVTTVKGHANVWGTMEPLDYRVADSGWTANDLFRQAHGYGALVSINHAYWPWDGRCPGCGWAWKNTDWSAVDAIEIINGYHEAGSWFKPPPGNGVPLWEQQLANGLRPTGVGGGDDHRAGEQFAEHDGVGFPTTMVYARELSQPAILEGIRKGHVYIRVTGPDGPELLLTAGDAMMGDELQPRAGAETTLTATAHNAPAGATLHLLLDGKAADAGVKCGGDAGSPSCTLGLRSDGRHHWIRAELRDDKGALLALTNPIYLNRVALGDTGRQH